MKMDSKTVVGYTRTQLIDAMVKYNTEFVTNPKDFVEIKGDDLQCAIRQIDHLINLIEPEYEK